MKNQFPSNIICCEYKLTVISLILKDTYPGRDPRGKVTWPGTASLSDKSWPSSSGPRPSHGKGWQCLTVERIKSQQTLKLQKSLYLCSHAHIRSCDFYQNNEKNYWIRKKQIQMYIKMHFLFDNEWKWCNYELQIHAYV